MGLAFYKTHEDALAFGVVPAFRRYELRAARYREMVPVVAPVLAAREDARILDVGCGFGEAKRFIDRLGRPARWTGVDLAPEQIAACRALGYETLVDGVDLEKSPLPLPDESFDVVIASHVLEHLDNAEEAFADWYRLLRPGGVLILGVPMHLGPVAWLARLRYRLRGRRPHRHCRFFSARTLAAFLRPYPVAEVIGFRLFSARRWLPLEDWAWFYEASRWFGRRFPGWTAEVNAVVTKPPRGGAEPRISG